MPFKRAKFNTIIKQLRENMLLKNEWFKTVCKSYNSPPVVYKGTELPGFPSDTIQTNTTGQSGVNTLKEAFVFYQDCIGAFKELGVPLESQHSLLDFGVGWGRIARFFLHELPLDNIYGVDVMEEFVQICKETFRSKNFSTCTPFPPSSMADEKIDYIVGYSVFSHLSEEACANWMREFYRILKPGGIVALTTRGRPFFDYCESLKGGGHTGYSNALSKMFDNFDDARSLYDSGKFVHCNASGVNGGGAMTSDFYGETFIPEPYAKTAYSAFFVLGKFLFDPARQTHPIMFFRKK